MKYTLRFEFEIDPPLTRNQQILLLDPFLDVLLGKASGAYRLRIVADSQRTTETCGFYDSVHTLEAGK